jgi:hypothetical protein
MRREKVSVAEERLMPYRKEGLKVQVKKPIGWITVKTHRSDEMANGHLKRLRAAKARKKNMKR